MFQKVFLKSNEENCAAERETESGRDNICKHVYPWFLVRVFPGDTLLVTKRRGLIYGRQASSFLGAARGGEKIGSAEGEDGASLATCKACFDWGAFRKRFSGDTV